MQEQYTIGMIGNGSWATALVKILTDNKQKVNWWFRNKSSIDAIKKNGHNPNYLSSASLDVSLLNLCSDVNEVIDKSDLIIIAVPSAYLQEVLESAKNKNWSHKKVLSAIKGLVPGADVLLNDYLQKNFHLPLDQYFAVLGPCHAEEVAAEKLSYLTFSGIIAEETERIATLFNTSYINTITNHDILGVQYAAVLKNVYALGAGISQGLQYGDNFLSVYIANSADEMAGFLRAVGAKHMVVGEHEGIDPHTHKKDLNYAASVYLGDLLVTCYSLYSRNRTFGSMIGKGYSVSKAQQELNMVAEGYYASKAIKALCLDNNLVMPIADTVYNILYEKMSAETEFSALGGKLC